MTESAVAPVHVERRMDPLPVVMQFITDPPLTNRVHKVPEKVTVSLAKRRLGDVLFCQLNVFDVFAHSGVESYVDRVSKNNTNTPLCLEFSVFFKTFFKFNLF